MNFFKKAKSLVIPKNDFEKQLKKTVNKLGDSFFDKLESVLQDRKEDPNNSNLTQDELEKVINDYAKKNMVIAAASAAAPGPLGVVAMVFEVTSMVGNQIKMTYDIGCAFDKENIINKDLLIDIPLHAFGIETKLDEVQNLSPDEIIESSVDTIKEKTTTLAKEMATKSVKKSLVKFIPIGGSVLLSIWAKSNTQKISKSAIYFFDDKKVLKTEKKTAKKIDYLLLEKLHLQTLLNLIKADNINSEEEIAFISPMIENSNLKESEKEELKSSLATNQIYHPNFQSFNGAPDEKEALLTDLVILYKRDELLHQNEINYILKVGKELGYEETYIQDLLADV